MMLRKIWNPILSGFEDAPITAIREGRNRGDRGEVIRALLASSGSRHGSKAGTRCHARRGDPRESFSPGSGAQARRTHPVRLHLRALLARRIDALDTSGYLR